MKGTEFELLPKGGFSQWENCKVGLKGRRREMVIIIIFIITYFTVYFRVFDPLKHDSKEYKISLLV